ncbi:MAG TPA: Fe-S-containing hydro-lyase [Chloroflexia bacterium]|nr:Fe-S-containing hydro-lyase [Chloroflexia bacterium]
MSENPNQEVRQIQLPLDDETIRSLHSGDMVEISGVMYTGRDAAHQRFHQALERGEELPVDLRGQMLYYVGPSPAKPGAVIGSAGPTTASRMDPFAPELIALGLKGMIGKGKRNETVKKALHDYTAVYFGAVGGLGILLSRCIKQAEVVAYPDLGPEAVFKLTVERFPAIVINDCHGGDLYASAMQQWALVED